jgi:hypothetical protein
LFDIYWTWIREDSSLDTLVLKIWPICFSRDATADASASTGPKKFVKRQRRRRRSHVYIRALIARPPKA